MTYFGRWSEWVLCIDEVLAWYEGVILRGYTLNKRENDWLLVVRADHPKKGRVVCFFTGMNPGDVWKHVAYLLANEPGVQWRPDRYVK